MLGADDFAIAGHGGGISCYGSSPTITNCNIINNFVYGGGAERPTPEYCSCWSFSAGNEAVAQERRDQIGDDGLVDMGYHYAPKSRHFQIARSKTYSREKRKREEALPSTAWWGNVERQRTMEESASEVVVKKLSEDRELIL